MRVKSLEIGNDCSALGCDEGAELVAVTFKEGLRGITIELCAKHSETIAPKLFKMLFAFSTAMCRIPYTSP